MQTRGTELVSTGTFNAGESAVYGGELELSWKTDTWDTYVALGYSKTEFDEFTTNTTDFSGNEFPNAPHVTAAAGGFYSHGNWVYGAEISYRDGYFASIDNAFETDSLTVVDLSLAYRFRDIAIRGFVNNVFDKSVLVNEPSVIEGQTLGTYSEPRAYGVELRYGFF